MAGDGESFLGRWSRLKKNAAAPAVAGKPPDRLDEAAAPAPADEPADLPNLADLTKDSDYTVFMRPEVADDVRQEALRKLWRSDPVFAEHDGLTDYAGDYRQQPGVIVRTAYAAGRGYLEEAVDAEQAATPKDEPARTAERAIASDTPEGEATSPLGEADPLEGPLPPRG